MISEKTVEEFRQVMHKEYGVEYTMQEASEALYNLVQYFELLAEMDRDNKKEEKDKEGR